MEGTSTGTFDSGWEGERRTTLWTYRNTIQSYQREHMGVTHRDLRNAGVNSRTTEVLDAMTRAERTPRAANLRPVLTATQELRGALVTYLADKPAKQETFQSLEDTLFQMALDLQRWIDESDVLRKERTQVAQQAADEEDSEGGYLVTEQGYVVSPEDTGWVEAAVHDGGVAAYDQYGEPQSLWIDLDDVRWSALAAYDSVNQAILAVNNASSEFDGQPYDPAYGPLLTAAVQLRAALEDAVDAGADPEVVAELNEIVLAWERTYQEQLAG